MHTLRELRHQKTRDSKPAAMGQREKVKNVKVEIYFCNEKVNKHPVFNVKRFYQKYSPDTSKKAYAPLKIRHSLRNELLKKCTFIATLVGLLERLESPDVRVVNQNTPHIWGVFWLFGQTFHIFGPLNVHVI
jgi:hypothetical protein